METLDDKVIVKNFLSNAEGGRVRDYECMIVGSAREISDDVVEAYQTYLGEQFGTRGNQIEFAVMEAIINYFQHANKFDPNKKVYIQSWRDDARFYFAISGESEEGFDPRKIWLTVDERNKNAGNYKFGRGHIIIDTFADYVHYDDDGKGMMMIFELNRKAA